MAKEYKVLKITEMVRPGEGEGIEKFYRHTIKTAGGVILSVEIPDADFTAEKVATLLSARAQQADKILKL